MRQRSKCRWFTCWHEILGNTSRGIGEPDSKKEELSRGESSGRLASCMTRVQSHWGGLGISGERAPRSCPTWWGEGPGALTLHPLGHCVRVLPLLRYHNPPGHLACIVYRQSRSGSQEKLQKDRGRSGSLRLGSTQ